MACLLLARGAAPSLPRSLASAERFADAVVAVDVATIDGSRAVLERHHLVHAVLDGDPELDDRALRQQLLEAAAGLQPDWIIFVDADESFSPTDGVALRQLVDRHASRDSAYGFTVYRMCPDGVHFDRVGPWVVRMFAWSKGARLRTLGLEGAMVPDDIGGSQWVRTTIRLQQHPPSPSPTSDPDKAADAHERYPWGYPRDDDWQAPYRPPREPSGPRLFAPRRPNRLIVPGGQPYGNGRRDDADPAADVTVGPDGTAAAHAAGPTLSAIVISRNDEDRIERCVRSAVEQACPEPFEVIVVTSGTDRTAAIVRDTFPDVTVVELDRPALPGEARNAGLRVARGEYISFPGSHTVVPPGSFAARIAAHDLGFAMVTGSIINGAESRAGWASYFLDHFLSLPGQPSRRLTAAPSHCSYTHEALLEVGGFPEQLRTGEDTEVNLRLFLVGHSAYRSSELTLIHRSPCETPRQLARHHFKRGVGYSSLLASAIRRGEQPVNRALLRRLAIDYVPTRLRSIHRNVATYGSELGPAYRRARPLVVLGALAAWAGIWTELIRSTRGHARGLLRYIVSRAR